MRFLLAFMIAALLTGGVFFIFPNIKDQALDQFFLRQFKTLEVRHSADVIMENNKGDLLKDSEHAFLEPKLEFHPYLLLEVKYNQSKNKTGEGMILWSLVDGEMVLDTQSWEKTHGFTDCINASATKDEFKVINTLAKKGGKLDRDGISKELNVENNILNDWLDSCRKKSLIVQSGNLYRLHLQNPKLSVLPETKVEDYLVTKQSKHATRVNKIYRPSQIELIAKSAFGNDFAIRKTTEIFLPVYTIIVQNPDGSQMTTYWNALNGKRIMKPYNE